MKMKITENKDFIQETPLKFIEIQMICSAQHSRNIKTCTFAFRVT